MPPKVLKKWGWWVLPGSRRLGHLVLILGRRADHHMIFHIFSIPFLPWVFGRRLFKVLRKKNEIHCTHAKAEISAFSQLTQQASTSVHVPCDSSKVACMMFFLENQGTSSFQRRLTLLLWHPCTQHHRVTPPIVRLALTARPQGQVSLAG